MKSTGDRVLALVEEQMTLVLATSFADGSPLASYAPFYREKGCFYVFLSQIAEHVTNLSQQPRASVMVIEDESRAANIFARRRATFRCHVEPVPRAEAEFAPILDQMRVRHGETLDLLRELPDFVLFKLRPISGHYVEGFGRAFAIHDPISLDTHGAGGAT